MKALNLLLSSKGYPVKDKAAALIGMKMQGGSEWPITTLTGSLPLTYESRVEHILKNYALYGSASGAGVACESGEPAGYKIPLTNTGENSQSSTYPLYIGSTKLGEEEYLDYESGKVYKRTENLWDEKYPNISNQLTYYFLYVGNGTFTLSSTTGLSTYANLFFLAGAVSTGATTSVNGVYTDRPVTVTSVDGYVTVAYRATVSGGKSDPRVNQTMLNSGETASSYIPYLQPTDPPVPFLAITAYQGENTLSSTETVGEVEITGRIKPIET